ncbi:LamB/YcsF family protein [compost metagenome]
MIHDPAAAAAQALRMVREQAIRTVGGKVVAMPVHTICVHGDNPQGVEIARAVRQALLEEGVRLRPISQLDFQ